MISERGQTTQDYILGVSIMLLTVFFAFGYVPTLFGSYQAPVDSVDRTQAERAADFLVSNFSVENRSNVLRFDASDDPAVEGIHDKLSTDAGFLRFRIGASLNTSSPRRARPNVNVTLVNTSQINGTGPKVPIRNDTDADGDVERFAYGQSYDEEEPAASTTRVVALDNSTWECRPTCWLIVRIW